MTSKLVAPSSARVAVPAVTDPARQIAAARRIELHLLRTFAAVAREGTLTRAAERLCLSQPAVSGHLKALEEELGVVLFNRVPSGMVVTSAGELLRPIAERALAATCEFAALAQTLRGGVAGEVRLGTIIDPEYLRLGSFLRTMIERHPMVRIETQHGISGWVRESVAAGQFDAGFCLGENDAPNVTQMPLTRVPYRIVGPHAWRDAIACADWAAMAELPWIWTSQLSSHNRVVVDVFRAQGLEPRKKMVVADQEAIMKSLVMAGVGVSLMREDLADAAQAGGEVATWPLARLFLPLSFAYRTERAADAVVVAMASALRATWPLPLPDATGAMSLHCNIAIADSTPRDS